MDEVRDENPGTVAVKAAPVKAEKVGPKELIHPALRRKQAKKRLDAKSRRTTVRTAKLVNATNPDHVSLVQVPIEPGHNNKGILSDPTQPLKHYLDKGFIWPHEYAGPAIMGPDGPINLNVIFCAVSNCWDAALATADPDKGTERCEQHEEMYRLGEIQYATAAREYRE